MFPKNTKPVSDFSTNVSSFRQFWQMTPTRLEDKIFFVTSSRKFLWFDEETGEHKVGKTLVGRFEGAGWLEPMNASPLLLSYFLASTFVDWRKVQVFFFLR